MQTEVFSWTSSRDVRSEMLVFPGFGGADRSFWRDVRRDVRPKTSSLGWIFVPEITLPNPYKGFAWLSQDNQMDQWGERDEQFPHNALQPVLVRRLNSNVTESLRIYPYPMVWPLPRPWSETMVSILLWAQKTLEIKGFLGLGRPFLDLVSQTPRPRGRGRPLFAELHAPSSVSFCHWPCD